MSTLDRRSKDCLYWIDIEGIRGKRELNGFIQAWALTYTPNLYTPNLYTCCLGLTAKRWLITHRKLLNATTKQCLNVLFKECSSRVVKHEFTTACEHCLRILGGQRGKIIFKGRHNDKSICETF
jgi:hypothetical protein